MEQRGPQGEAAGQGADGPAARSERVKAHARRLGFDLVGIAPTEVPEAFGRFEAAMDAGYGADMRWLTDARQARRSATEVQPDARSVVVVGVSYASDTPGYLAAPPGPDEGWISRYAQGKDYHAHVRKMLVNLVRAFQDDPKLGLPSHRHRVFTDTGPVLEKAFAQRAGLGWIGKNALLVSRSHGSWVFLGVVLTPLDLAPDAPGVDHCGSCRRCLDVCPTDAFPRPYVLDARRCISAWTIESDEPQAVIDPSALGQHVFGCDLCQEVCPWNRKAPPTRHAPLAPRPENVRPRLDALLALDEDAFKARFPKSAVRRVDAHRMGSVIRVIQARDAAAPPSDSLEE